MIRSRGTLFKDRRDAGRKLAEHVAELELSHPVVLALPRGGVPVGYEIAVRLNAALDLALVRKIGAPGFPELGLGAVVDGKDPQVVLNEEVLRSLHPPRDYIGEETKRQLQEIERRRELYGSRVPIDLADKDVIITDDGIATGGTIRVVLQAVRRLRPKSRVIAVPVAPPEVVEMLDQEADVAICLAMPEPFGAVGMYYEDFSQTSDEEVIALLRELDRRQSAAA